MTTHHMGLFEGPFQSMITGRKTVEVRLNDEKRRHVQVGDLIKFTELPDKQEKLVVEVVGLKQFGSFRELYETIPAENFDGGGKSVDEMVDNTYEIYTREQERTGGTLAIQVKVLK